MATNRENIELTDAMKEKIRSFVGFELREPFKYVPKIYRTETPREYWPIFTLKSKDGIEIAEIEDLTGTMAYDAEKEKSILNLQSGSLRMHTLRRGILSVENLMMESGEFITWDKESGIMTIRKGDIVNEKRNITIDDIIRRMPIALQVDLQDAINERRGLSKEELLSLES